MSANQSIFVELMTHVLNELKVQKDTINIRTFIQCIGVIWYFNFVCTYCIDIPLTLLQVLSVFGISLSVTYWVIL